MCSLERVVTAEGRLHSTTFRTVPIDNGTCWDMFIGCVAVWSARFFRGSNTPPASDRWAVEGVHCNYYAITHKPIDLDWTPGGRAARSWARPDLLQDQARKWYLQRDLRILKTGQFDRAMSFLHFSVYSRMAEDFHHRVLCIAKKNI